MERWMAKGKAVQTRAKRSLRSDPWGDVERGTKCEWCRKRQAKIVYSANGILGMTHSWSLERICRQCSIRESRKTIERCRKSIKEDLRLIRKEDKSGRAKRS